MLNAKLFQNQSQSSVPPKTPLEGLLVNMGCLWLIMAQTQSPHPLNIDLDVFFCFCLFFLFGSSYKTS